MGHAALGVLLRVASRNNGQRNHFAGNTTTCTWLTSNCTTSGARQTCRVTSSRTPNTLKGQPCSMSSSRSSRANVLTSAGAAGGTLAGARRSWPAPARHAKHGRWAADVDLHGLWQLFLVIRGADGMRGVNLRERGTWPLRARGGKRESRPLACRPMRTTSDELPHG